MKIHIIAIGGRIMHTLGLLMVEKGHEVTGSDDEIYEPSRSRLDRAGILPEEMGWKSSRLSSEIDLVILGMHARKDNPELLRAQELGLKIMSYPEFIFDQSREKKRIVVAGSHGKTSTTAMIMHVLKYRNFDFDYLVGAELDGFGSMVKLSDAPLIVIEGDEYLSSSIDRRPKMQHYKPHMSVITGIAWDHINVFKTEEEYDKLFRLFLEQHSDDAKVFYYENDPKLEQLTKEYERFQSLISYKPLDLLENGNVAFDKKQYRIKVFGEHNRANMSAALNVCLELGITAPDFFAAISTFKGASKRMELLHENESSKVYRDFAHAPSKLKATVNAVKEHFPNHRLYAFFELHTFSSLSKPFLPKYNGALSSADESCVYFSSHTLEIKGLPALEEDFVRASFGSKELTVVSQKEELISVIQKIKLENAIVLFMSSGTFDHTNIHAALNVDPLNT